MTTYSTDICAPADDAPTTTEQVARCQVCGVQWAVQSDADMEGCSFCGASARAITVVSEAPGYGGAVIR